MKDLNLINDLKIYANQEINLIYKSIAEFLLANMHKIANVKLEEIANDCNCAQASVIKFAKKLGYIGTKDLLPALERNYSFWKFHNQRGVHDSKEILYTESILSYHKLMQDNFEYIINFNMPAILEASKILKKAKHVMLFGKGSNLEVINTFASYLSKLNYHVDHNFDFEVQQKWVEKFSHDSVCIFFSFSGIHTDIDQILDKAQQRGAKIIGFTANHESKLFKVSNVALITKNNEDFLPGHTTARIAFTYIFMQIINLIK